MLPCQDCRLGCGIATDIALLWERSFPPAAEDVDFRLLIETLISTLSRLIRRRLIRSPEDFGIGLAALFDLCVSLEYARLVTDIGWVYCPGIPEKEMDPLSFYPYVKSCPRCASYGKLVRIDRANKPSSDTIGHISAKVLGTFLDVLTRRVGSPWKVRLIERRIVDVDIILFREDLLVIGEIKASPLVAFPLACPTGPLIEKTPEGENRVVSSHKQTTVPLHALDRTAELRLVIPHIHLSFPLGRPRGDGGDYPLRRFCTDYAGDDERILAIITAWRSLYEGYEHRWQRAGDASHRWLTFGCGGGVDDSKNGPGLDRTDDIKKGVYQMLKIGEKFVNKCRRRVIKVAILSNIHAVLHQDGYVSWLEDIVWTHETGVIDLGESGWKKIRVEDLIKLYDAAINFTRPHFRVDSIAAGFDIGQLFASLGGK